MNTSITLDYQLPPGAVEVEVFPDQIDIRATNGTVRHYVPAEGVTSNAAKFEIGQFVIQRGLGEYVRIYAEPVYTLGTWFYTTDNGEGQEGEYQEGELSAVGNLNE